MLCSNYLLPSFPNLSTVLLCSLISVLLPYTASATSILVKRPSNLVISLPALPYGPAREQPSNGAAVTAPVCDPAFGSPKSGECVCAFQGMERDTFVAPRTIYHGGQISSRMDVSGVVGHLSTPRVYQCGSCVIAMYPLAETDSDIAIRDAVRFSVGRVILNCVRPDLPDGDIRKTGGLTIAGVYRKLYISVSDVPTLPDQFRDRDQVTVNDPGVLDFLKRECNWPATSRSWVDPNSPSRQNFEVLTCGSTTQSGGSRRHGGGGDDAAETLRQEMVDAAGQRACTVDGTGDGSGACGDGLNCRKMSWAEKVGQVLFGVAGSALSDTGTCILE